MSKVVREVSVAIVLRRLSTVFVSSKLTTDCPDGPLIRNLMAGGTEPFRVKVKESPRLEMFGTRTQRPAFHDVKLGVDRRSGELSALQTINGLSRCTVDNNDILEMECSTISDMFIHGLQWRVLKILFGLLA